MPREDRISALARSWGCDREAREANDTPEDQADLETGGAQDDNFSVFTERVNGFGDSDWFGRCWSAWANHDDVPAPHRLVRKACPLCSEAKSRVQDIRQDLWDLHDEIPIARLQEKVAKIIYRVDSIAFWAHNKMRDATKVMEDLHNLIGYLIIN